jgi:hypothetical protein
MEGCSREKLSSTCGGSTDNTWGKNCKYCRTMTGFFPGRVRFFDFTREFLMVLLRSKSRAEFLRATIGRRFIFEHFRKKVHNLAMNARNKSLCSIGRSLTLMFFDG